jgi:Ni,Fe-hydrogenase III small subunit
MAVFGTFKGYVTAEIRVTITGRPMNADLVIVPGGMTSQMQVLNVVVNEPFRTT